MTLLGPGDFIARNSRAMKRRRLRVEELLLPLRDIAHLFNAPRIDPWSAATPEVLGQSGAECVLDQVRPLRRGQAEVLIVALPGERVVPGLAEQAEEGLRRFAWYRIEQQETYLVDVRRRGRRAILISLVILAVCLSLASFVGGDSANATPSLVHRTVQSGLEITGWVMMWHPLKLLIFEPFVLKDRIMNLRKMIDLRVVVRSWEECAFGPGFR